MQYENIEIMNTRFVLKLFFIFLLLVSCGKKKSDSAPPINIPAEPAIEPMEAECLSLALVEKSPTKTEFSIMKLSEVDDVTKQALKNKNYNLVSSKYKAHVLLWFDYHDDYEGGTNVITSQLKLIANKKKVDLWEESKVISRRWPQVPREITLSRMNDELRKVYECEVLKEKFKDVDP